MRCNHPTCPREAVPGRSLCARCLAYAEAHSKKRNAQMKENTAIKRAAEKETAGVRTGRWTYDWERGLSQSVNDACDRFFRRRGMTTWRFA